MWNLIGSVVALFTAVLAWRQSRAPGGFYAEGVYGMVRRTTGVTPRSASRSRSS